jgi:C4-dicarboxylate-specific signal transduction histidine kinase
MSSDWELIGRAGFLFFGKMAASISHEIKNVLAIINENAGLLEDITLMAERGTPINSDRIKTQAERIKKQVRRADVIVKNMNGFAHSADEPLMSVDLGEILELLAALSGRFAYTRGVTLEPASMGSSATITTNPFLLENLVWLCLDFAMEMAGRGKTVGLIAEKPENDGRIRFTQLEALGEPLADKFPGEVEKALLVALKAQITKDVEAGELVLTISKNIEH